MRERICDEQIYGNSNKDSNTKQQIELRGEEIEKRVKKKERIIGKKEIFEEGETVLIQDLKTKKWILKAQLRKSELLMMEKFPVMIS